jgi:rubredoxin
MTDLVARLEERAPSPTCGVCGGTDWAVAKDGIPLTFLSFEAKEDPRVRVLGVVCLNCGYVRFHALDVLE